MAMTMAFHFKNLKIAAFNSSGASIGGALIEQAAASLISSNFKSCKIIVYESRFDVASFFSKVLRFRNSLDWQLSGKNVEYRKMRDGGWHQMKEVKEYLKVHGQEDIF